MPALSRVISLLLLTTLILTAAQLSGDLFFFLDVFTLAWVILGTVAGTGIAHGMASLLRALLAGLLSDKGQPRHLHTLTTAYPIAWSTGSVATLLTLISIFKDLSDPATFGSAFAVSLLPMLYAAIFAELVIAPLRRAMMTRNQAENP